MKWLRRLLWVVLAVFVLMVVVSQGMAWWWGRDVVEISHRSGERRFSARRDAVSGAWDIAAPDDTSLWFAFGYLQSHDREFQTELLRLAARGEASRLLGETVLKNDRLMRFSRRAAEQEYARADALSRTAAEAFVAGREAALADPERMQPIEYQIMGITREELPPWEPSDVMAIARFHAWQLSFDSNLEQLWVKVSSRLGIEAARLLLPTGKPEALALYAQARLFEGVDRSEVLRRERNSSGLDTPKMFYPESTHAASSRFDGSAPQGQRRLLDFGSSLNFDLGTPLALRGASNLWVIADPRVGRPLTLCNDAHLRFSWPASLYPVRFHVEGKSRGTGFMLPGVPAMVIGTHESRSPSRPGTLFSWGITVASYGDAQDLIVVDSQDHSRFVVRPESYPVRDLQSGRIEVRKISETWTPWGPRVDDIFPEESKALGARVLTLDWVGYTQLESPLEFFLRRTADGSEGLVGDLHERLPYPSLNFTWIEREGKAEAKIGHLLTGWLRARKDRERAGLTPLRSSQVAAVRREVQPRDRDYFLRFYKGRDPFFLVTANQRIGEGPEGLESAHSWEPGDRARAIVEAFDANVRDPAASQTDFRAPQLVSFLASERRRNSADRLCADAPISSSQCLDLVARLDAWDGVSTAESWETTLAALWHAYAKQEFFMGLVPLNLKEPMNPVLKDWHRRSFSSVAMERSLSEEPKRLVWEKVSGRAIAQLSLESFRKSLALLVSERGADTRLWGWGHFHRIDWLHPLAQAPEPWGTVIHDSLLGPRPGVPGALDSPGRFDYSWDPARPLEFPATHGAALRMCTEFNDAGGVSMRWSAPSGPSGNPFSKYAKAWSFKTFFAGLLSDIP